jgi:hypothetical protein
VRLKTWSRRLLAVTFVAATFPTTLVQTSGGTRAAASSETVRASYVRLPLRFEQGQGDGFDARGAGYAVSISPRGAALLLSQPSSADPVRLTMRLVGGDVNARPHAHRTLTGVSNYLTGNDRTRWRTGVRGYGEIAYRSAYRGIDVVYYGNQRQLEFDFAVAPGANPDVIALSFDGASHVSVDRAGDLVIDAGAGCVIQHRPDVYQDDHGIRRSIDGRYVVDRAGKVRFRIERYDHRLPLVIDPTLSYMTYLGGTKHDRIRGMAIDSAGNAIVAGETFSPDFPGANGAQPLANQAALFVTKIAPTGDAVLYTTFFGPAGVSGVAVDDAGNAYVAGNTRWSLIPFGTSIGPMGTTINTINMMFVAKFDTTGALVYSTRIGGSGDDSLNALAVDRAGRAHIAGVTFSGDFPVAHPWQDSLGGYAVFRTTDGATWTGVKSGLRVSGVDAFAFDTTQAGTVYAGSLNEGLFRTIDDGATWTRTAVPAQGIKGVAVQGDAIFAAGDQGLYRSHDHGDTWTSVSPYQALTALAVTQESPSALYIGTAASVNVQRSVDGGDTWSDTGLAGPVQMLAASGGTVYAVANNALYISTNGNPWIRITGSPLDEPFAQPTTLAVDAMDANVAYLGTAKGLFVTTSGGTSWTPIFPGFTFYVAAAGIAPSDPSTIVFTGSLGTVATHDGGQTWMHEDLNANAASIEFDPHDAGHIYVGGYQSADAFIATLSADGSSLEYSTYLGGSSHEQAWGIAVDGNGNRYVTGDTFSQDLPTVHPIRPTFGGLWDSFVAKISPDGTPVYVTYLGGSAATYSARVVADAAGRAYVTGATLATNFPVVNAFQPTHGGGFYDAFVTALNEDGSAFVYSTYLGGSGWDVDSSGSITPVIAVTPSGEAFVTGSTQSTDFPITPDAWHHFHAGGVTDVFVSHFDAAGALRYSTYLGGTGQDYAQAIAVDSTGAMIIAGYTDSPDWTTRSAVQPAYAGSDDGFVVRMSPEPAPPDTIPPTTTIALSGTPGAPGWYTTPVTITLSAVDNDQGRGVAFIEYSLNGAAFQRYAAPITISASGTTHVIARATDFAGNVENPAPSAMVAIDTTPPSVGLTVTGTAGLAGWLDSPATVSVTATDTGGSGVASVEYQIGDGPFQPYSAPFSITANGTTRINARATDANGNVGTTTRTVAIDTSAPHTTIAASGTPGLSGWYRSPVTIALTAVDNAAGSGVARIDDSVNGAAFQLYTAPFIVASEGATRVTARATDNAGNVEVLPPTATVLIDVSAPVVAVSLPTPGFYLHTDAPVPSFSATDSVSGVQTVSGSVEGTLVQNGQPMSLLTLALGDHTLSVTAADVAGNQTTQSQPFMIVATVDSLITAVNLFGDQGRIDSSPQKSLLATLTDAKAALARGNTSAASGDLKDFISLCAAQSGKGIAVDVAAWLTTDATYVLTTI